MNIQHLRYASEVERCGSINKAAKNLGITQPYLSNCLKSLENSLGVTLFERSVRGMVPTAAGCEVVEIARELVAKSDELMERYSDGKWRDQTFKIAGVRSWVAMEAALDFFQRYAQRNEYRFEFLEADLTELIDNIDYYNVNIGVAFYYTSQRNMVFDYIRDKAIRMNELASLPLHVLVRPEHPLAGRAAVCGADLDPYPVINCSYKIDTGEDNAGDARLVGAKPPKRVFYLSDRNTLTYTLVTTDAYMVSHKLGETATRRNKVVSIPVEGAKDHIHYAYVAPKKLDFAVDTLERDFVNLLKAKLRNLI